MGLYQKKMSVVIMLLISIVVLVIISGVFIFNKAFDKLEICTKDIIKEEILYDGEYKVVGYIENCGITTGFSPKVAIVEDGDEINMKNIIFIGEHSLFIDFVFDYEEGVLKVMHDVEEEYIFKNVAKYNGIEAQYKYIKNI